MIREILRMGDPRLWRISAPVERCATPELEALLADLRDARERQRGARRAAGLAPPRGRKPLAGGFRSPGRT